MVVHVIYHSESENISPEQVASQIAALNRDYRSRNNPELVPPPFRAAVADPLIEFALAARDPAGNVTTGITRKRTTRTSFPYDPFDPEATAKLDELVKTDEYGRSPWPADDYLNLWTCTLDGGLLGYAQFPGGRPETDGVVILEHRVRVDRNCGRAGQSVQPGSNRRSRDRTLAQPPPYLGRRPGRLHGFRQRRGHAEPGGSNSSKPAFPHVTCGNAPNGDMFMNYMDYVDDEAMFMFSAGQVGRMDATLAGPRKANSEFKGTRAGDCHAPRSRQGG